MSDLKVLPLSGIALRRPQPAVQVASGDSSRVIVSSFFLHLCVVNQLHARSLPAMLCLRNCSPEIQTKLRKASAGQAYTVRNLCTEKKKPQSLEILRVNCATLNVNSKVVSVSYMRQQRRLV